MISHIHQSIRLWTLLLAAVLLGATGVAGNAQTIGCEYQCPNRPTIQLHPNANVAPQTGVLQNLTDPTIINILPGKVVDRGAFNRPPPQPNIQILGQQNGQPGQPGQPGTPGITRINGMPPAGETRFVPDQVLVMSRGALPQQVLDRIAQFGFTLIEQQNLTIAGVFIYEFRINDLSTMSVRDAIRILTGANLANVPLVQPNYLFQVVQQAPAPASANQSQQGGATQYVVEKWKLADVHRIVTGNNIIIAVIDSEIDTGHPDLAGVVRQRFSAVGAPEQPHPHGTGMAGAIASHQRLVGIAPNARLLAVHAFSTKAATAESTTFQILKGIDWSVLQGARDPQHELRRAARSVARTRPQGRLRPQRGADRSGRQCRSEIAAAVSRRRSERDRRDRDRRRRQAVLRRQSRTLRGDRRAGRRCPGAGAERYLSAHHRHLGRRRRGQRRRGVDAGAESEAAAGRRAAHPDVDRAPARHRGA